MTTFKPNPKPFWKEPSLKHVWARLNDGAKVMLYGVLYVAMCALFAQAISQAAALWMVGCGIGFVFGWIFHDLMQPVWVKGEDGQWHRVDDGR